MIAIAWDGTDVRTALIRIDDGLVVCVDDTGGTKGAEGLGEHVDGNLRQGNLRNTQLAKVTAGLRCPPDLPPQ